MSTLDLTRFLPARYRDKTIDTLLKGAFNRHLSEESSIPLFGYVGDPNALAQDDVKIKEPDLERQFHQLTPLIRVKHGSEVRVFSWPDLVQKLVLLGVDYKKLDSWYRSRSYNFAPPIDLDKFCNFNQYYWIGPWVTTNTSLPYTELGIPTLSTVSPAFTTNPTYLPEYYVIKRGAIDGSGNPIGTLPEYAAHSLPGDWPDWALVNLWVHRDDALTFVKNHPGTVDFGKLPAASKPILEYLDTLKLNLYVQGGVPADSGTLTAPVKYRANQPPMFDLYVNDETASGVHSGYTSSIFFYAESPDYPIDADLQRRLITDSEGNFVFSHSLVRDDGSLYFYKNWSA